MQLERSDLETQYILYYQGDRTTGIEKEQYLRSQTLDLPYAKWRIMYKTISVKGFEQDENGN